MFAQHCTTSEDKLARVGWLINELARNKKRSIASELKISRTTLARYTCTTASDWTDMAGPVKIQTLERLLNHLGLRLEVVLAAAQEARTADEMLHLSRGQVRLIPPGAATREPCDCLSRPRTDGLSLAFGHALNIGA